METNNVCFICNGTKIFNGMNCVCSEIEGNDVERREGEKGQY